MAFYKFENELLIAPNFVVFPDGVELFAEQKDSYGYPVNDWYWFDTIEEAKVFYGITE